MAPRPYWKGYLKLSLVSCPIALHSAISGGERIAFRQINKATGNRLRQQLIDEMTREVVESENKGRGYEYAKGEFIQVEDDELDAVAIESNHTIEIDKFVPHSEIDERYFESTYYVTPNDEVGVEAFSVIRDAMRGKGMVALGRVVLSKRERVLMLQPWDKGLMGTTLRYAAEVRPAKDYLDEIPTVKVPGEMLKLAEHILESKRDKFDATAFVDHYEEAIAKMLAKKQAGAAVSKTAAASAPRNVVNLMDALRRSVQAEGNTPAKASKTAKNKKRVPGQGEMLLPIAGSKAAVKKPAAQSTSRRRAG